MSALIPLEADGIMRADDTIKDFSGPGGAALPMFELAFAGAASGSAAGRQGRRKKGAERRRPRSGMVQAAECPG